MRLGLTHIADNHLFLLPLRTVWANRNLYCELLPLCTKQYMISQLNCKPHLILLIRMQEYMFNRLTTSSHVWFEAANFFSCDWRHKGTVVFCPRLRARALLSDSFCTNWTCSIKMNLCWAILASGENQLEVPVFRQREIWLAKKKKINNQTCICVCVDPGN